MTSFTVTCQADGRFMCVVVCCVCCEGVVSVVFVFVWRVHCGYVCCCVRVCMACARCVCFFDGVVLSGRANVERNRDMLFSTYSQTLSG